MMQEKIDQFVSKVDGMSLRERALIFAAAAFALVSLINTFFLDPLLVKQKRMSSQVVQQQEKMKEIQAQLTNLLAAKQADEHAPQRERIHLLRERIAEGDAYLKATQDKLVPPDKMAALLEQVLAKNTRLQLVALNTLPVSLFIEPAVGAASSVDTQDKKIFKHGVQMTVRGNYADLMQYLAALEKMPTQMFWGMAKMNVVQYPNAELTLTLYTLSLDKTWLQV
ncbi:MAG: type II secretion system protein GspM [Sideroxydans sp.]|jgi:MSHA biogenesis protein MshJ